MLLYKYTAYLIIASYIHLEGEYFSYYILTHLIDYISSNTTWYYAMYVKKIWIFTEIWGFNSDIYIYIYTHTHTHTYIMDL